MVSSQLPVVSCQWSVVSGQFDFFLDLNLDLNLDLDLGLNLVLDIDLDINLLES